jgi:hypothetical protein
MRTLSRWATAIGLICLPNVVWAASGIVLNVSTATIVPGATITGSGTPTGAMDVANGAGLAVDALGIGAASANVTKIPIIGGGYLYTSPYNLDVTLSGTAKNKTVTITATIGSFTSPTTSFGASNCLLAAGSCSSSGSFTALSASPVAVITPTTVSTSSTTFTPTIALSALNANGSAYTGSDDVTITFTASVPGFSTTATLNLTARLQNVIQLTLGTAPGGLTVGPGSDYSLNFGNVNALGIGTPSVGLTKTAVSNGTIYSSPYLVQPFFADQSFPAGKIEIKVSTPFTHTSYLELDDAATCCSGSAFTAIPSAPPTAQITGVSSGSSITRYLGLLVKKGNGAGSSGSDNAILTFTLTVP